MLIKQVVQDLDESTFQRVVRFSSDVSQHRLISALAQLALSRARWSTLDTLVVGNLLLALSYVVQSFTGDCLTSVLLCLSCGASFDWADLASDLGFCRRYLADGRSI